MQTFESILWLDSPASLPMACSCDNPHPYCCGSAQERVVPHPFHALLGTNQDFFPDSRPGCSINVTTDKLLRSLCTTGRILQLQHQMTTLSLKKPLTEAFCLQLLISFCQWQSKTPESEDCTFPERNVHSMSGYCIHTQNPWRGLWLCFCPPFCPVLSHRLSWNMLLGTVLASFTYQFNTAYNHPPPQKKSQQTMCLSQVGVQACL